MNELKQALVESISREVENFLERKNLNTRFTLEHIVEVVFSTETIDKNNIKECKGHFNVVLRKKQLGEDMSPCEFCRYDNITFKVKYEFLTEIGDIIIS